MEVAPLPSIFLCFWCPSLLAAWNGCPDTFHIFSVLCSMGWGLPFPGFFYEGFPGPNCCIFCLSFCSILMAYRRPCPRMRCLEIPFFWMYLYRAPRYLSTICRSKYLIPILVCKVWKIFVNSGTAWSLSLPQCGPFGI
jgi:hypothetical protein